MNPSAKVAPKVADMTLREASEALKVSPAKCRTLLREGVIHSTKKGNRWFVRSNSLQLLLTPQGGAFLKHPFDRIALAEDEDAAAKTGWNEHLAGTTTLLSDIIRAYRHESPKL